jgi:magnesium-transporting ATPase (P-type)
MEHPWCRTVEQVAQDFSVDLATGLGAEEVLARRGKYGTNELEKEQATPLWKLILEQFDDMLVKVRWGGRLLRPQRPARWGLRSS